jgi:acyl-homoserine-lactone acylase
MLAEHPRLSLERLVELQFSTRMELADRVIDELVDAARRSGDATASRAADVLAGWDRQALPDSTGTLLFLFWVPAMRPADFLTLSDLFSIPWNPAQPLTTPRGLKDPDRAVEALIVAADRVQSLFGRLDMPWGEVARLQRGSADLPANGAPGDPFGVFRVLYFDDSPLEEIGRMPAIGGDSYVAAIEFSDPVQARVLLTYGNASQPGSPHIGDQLALSAKGQMRVAWRTREEIEEHLEAREVLMTSLASGAG